MDTNQISNILSSDCNLATLFSGVYACDRLPVNCEQPAALVSNTDSHDKPGTHWVVIFIRDGVGEYFDSFGMPPLNPYFIDFLNRNCSRWNFNNDDFQSVGSTVCGHYCIWFLSQRAGGRSLQEIQGDFCSSNVKNDKIIAQLVKQKFGNPVSYKTWECQSCLPRCKDAF